MSKYSQNPEHKTHREVLDDISSCGHTNCILKEIILRENRIDDRMLEQIKCIEKFKWVESETQGKDIGWNQANMLWTINSYAEIFSEVYKEDLSNGELYEIIMARNKDSARVDKS